MCIFPFLKAHVATTSPNRYIPKLEFGRHRTDESKLTVDKKGTQVAQSRLDVGKPINRTGVYELKDPISQSIRMLVHDLSQLDFAFTLHPSCI